MRTTLDIDDDLLSAARERAAREGKTIGQIVSDLLRRALTMPSGGSLVREAPPVYGFAPFPPSGAIVTNDVIDKLRADDAY